MSHALPGVKFGINGPMGTNPLEDPAVVTRRCFRPNLRDLHVHQIRRRQYRCLQGGSNSDDDDGELVRAELFENVSAGRIALDHGESVGPLLGEDRILLEGEHLTPGRGERCRDGRTKAAKANNQHGLGAGIILACHEVLRDQGVNESYVAGLPSR